MPSLDWNGNQGTVSLSRSLAGLSVNSTTGQLSWTKLLPPGTHTLDVVASNSAGQVVVPLTLDNPFDGRFEGVYDESRYFAHDVRADGTVTIAANSQTNPDTGTGTWRMDGDRFVFEYTYTGNSESYFTLLDLEQTASGATLTGEYGRGLYTPGAPIYGPVTLSLN